MKKLTQLLIVETDGMPPLLNEFSSLLSSFSEQPPTVLFFDETISTGSGRLPELLLLHTSLTTVDHLRQFVDLRHRFPFSSIILVGEKQDEELCLQALEAGADDVIAISHFDFTYLRKIVLLAQRRFRTEKELAQNREQLLACLQNTPNVAVQLYNSNSEVIFWNAASERIFGWKAEEAVGRTIDQLILIPENRNFWRNKIHHLANAGGSYGPEEWAFRYRDGREGCCISTLVPIPSFDDKPWFVCMDVEITERKEIEKALLLSEEKYRSLIEQQADAITVFNKDGRILDVNGSASTLLLYSKDELLQMTLADVLLRDELMVNPVDFVALETGVPTIKQRGMRRKDGTVIQTEVHAKRLHGGLFFASVRDLSERLEIQNQLQKEIALSDTIINSLPGLFYLIRKDGQQLRWNKRLEILSGYSHEEISRMSPLDFFAGDTVYDVFHTIEKVYETGSAEVEAYLVAKDGRRIPFYFTGIAIEYAGAPCMLGTGTDLSALKRLEKELAQQKIASQKKIMQAMIEAEEKEKAKLGLELHDNVNQILSVVRMYLSILNSGQPMEEVTLPKAMDLLNNAIAEIRHLSHSLAVSYKFETGLSGALEEAIENIQATRGFTIDLLLPPDLDERTNDNQKLALYRIVQEQLSNIIRHAKATKVLIAVTLSENEIGLKVQDNGRGFDPENAKRGLGLSNMTNRAEALGGTVNLYSKPGEGTRLDVIMPL